MNTTQANSTRNYMKLNSEDEKRCRYAFIDSNEHHADRILMGALIPVRFESQNRIGTSKVRFEVRICSFESRYESWFLCCMSDLEWVLSVEGGYSGSCEELLGPIAYQEHDVSNRLAHSKPKVHETDDNNKAPIVAAGLSRLRLPAANVNG